MAKDDSTLGRPTKFRQDLADKICERVASSSDSLRLICSENKIDYSTVKRWLISNEDFCAQYARAKEQQADHMAEEMLDIADDNTQDIKKIMKGGEVIEIEDTEVTNRSKLRVETRKWLAGKLKPKKYGDKLQTEHSGSLNIAQITGMEIK